MQAETEESVKRLYQGSSQKDLVRDGSALLDLHLEPCGSFYNDAVFELTPTSGKLKAHKCA